MSTYPAQPLPSAFERATMAFGELLARVRAACTPGVDHAAAERLIAVDGREPLRLLLQGWVDARAEEARARDVVGADGVLRTHHRAAVREVESVFGTVHVERDRVGARGSVALAPVDARMNLAADRFTFGVRERVVEESVRGSFDAAVEAVDGTSGASVAKRQAEELVRAAALDFDAFYEAGMRVDIDPVEPNALLVMTTDGKGVVMRQAGLRPATQEAAAKEQHKLGTRLSRGEKRNRKRMATVAAVYTIAPEARTADDVVGNLNHTAPSRVRPKARQKRVWASIEKPTQDVIREMFAEANRRDPAHAQRWVALVDGNATQIRLLRAGAKANGVSLTLVLDLIHVIEYLWSAAWNFFQEGDRKAELWVADKLRQVLHGRASVVAAAMRRSATYRQLTSRKAVDQAAAYLLNHTDMLRYDEYLRDGLPIATGVIEGACRHLVKDRMDITGARWGLEGAEAILRLRSLKTSGDLDRYWTFHRDREFMRNHLSRYAANEDVWLLAEAA